MRDLVELTRRFSVLIENDRDLNSILKHLKSEVKELDAEVENGSTGKDGIVGEAIDIILCALDMIFRHDPAITNAQILTIAEQKNLKWAVNYGKLDRPAPERALGLPQRHSLEQLELAGWRADMLATSIQVGIKSFLQRILTMGDGIYACWEDGRLEPLHGLYSARILYSSPEDPRITDFAVVDLLFAHGKEVLRRERDLLKG